jgi:hypothetical protein
MCAVPDIPAAVSAALLLHPGVRSVRLVGSRATGTAVPLSDWDFKVESDLFGTLEDDLPDLTVPLRPIAEQWDRLSPHRCYMLILRGPSKIDLLFLDQPHQPEPPWHPNRETLPDIDRHFWDWALWLAAKQQAGKDELVRSELDKMTEHLLAPMGVPDPPGSLETAVDSYRAARDDLEARFTITIARRLEREVWPVLPKR